jgi:hypothetical protein
LPNARDSATVSARALIMRAAPEASFDHAGTSPQRATVSTRSAVRVEVRMIGAGSVGAML